MTTRVAAIAAVLVIAVAAGCSHSAPDRADGTQLHVARPPHGGTVVTVGDDYRIEFVSDPGNGTLTAYVLDDELEEFIRIANPSLELDVAADRGAPRTLILQAAASSATGETAGNTSEFDGHADWLKALPAFHGTLKAITIRGSTFRDLPVNLPGTHDQG